MKLHSRKSNNSKKKKEFCDMSRTEKKNFLSMDLADRMIRIEQKVSAHFNKNIPYKETEYYKSMTASEKKEFEKHITANKARKICLTMLVIVPIALLIILNTSMTANVVKDNFGISYSNSTKFFIWAGAMIFAIALLIKSFSKRITESRDDSHLDVFENIHIRRHIRKKNKKGF